MFKEIYEYRQLLKSNVKKEIRGKYKGSFLGVLWSFVNPLLATLVYALVFPFLLKGAQPHYVTFIVVAILPWNWFTTVVALGTTTVIGNGGILKKVYFPRQILPISVNVSGMINFLISCLIIAIFLIISGIGFSPYILFLPFIVIIQFFILQGIIFITSSINVYVRDLEYIVNFFVQLLFYGTPILYSVDMFPKKVQTILHLNPMATIIESYRDIFFYQQCPNLINLVITFIFSVVLFLLGYRVFKKLEKGFAEEL